MINCKESQYGHVLLNRTGEARLRPKRVKLIGALVLCSPKIHQQVSRQRTTPRVRTADLVLKITHVILFCQALLSHLESNE